MPLPRNFKNPKDAGFLTMVVRYQCLDTYKVQQMLDFCTMVVRYHCLGTFKILQMLNFCTMVVCIEPCSYRNTYSRRKEEMGLTEHLKLTHLR